MIKSIQIVYHHTAFQHIKPWPALLLATGLLVLAGCEKKPLQPQAALQSPTSFNDPSSMLDQPVKIQPLVVVSLPSTPEGKPHVDTVLSVLLPHPPAKAASLPPPPVLPPTTVMQVHEEAIPDTQPATAPATNTANSGGTGSQWH